MKENVFHLPSVWSDMFIAFGIIAASAILGFSAHKFALHTNLFMNGFGL